jgi:N-methylhydantoinase A/oxoprolinase/acetone carboxylase beta subunit
LGSDDPAILETLRNQQAIKKRTLLPWVGQFLIARRPASAGLRESDRALVERLADGPIALVDLAQDGVWGAFLADRVQRLVAQQVAMRVGFTPTDALHVLRRFEIWSTEAARLGAELLARQLEITAEAFARHVAAAVSNRVATEVVTKVLSDEVAPANWRQEPIAAGLLARALNLVDETDLACRFQLRQPVVAVGAPVSAYMPGAAGQLNTELVLPEHAGVANAIGAVVGSVVQRAAVLIRPIEFGEFFRVHLPGSLGLDEGVRDFESVEAGIAYAHQVVPPRLREITLEAGARQVEIRAERTDHTGPIKEKINDSVFLESILTFTAVGRPATTKV